MGYRKKTLELLLILLITVLVQDGEGMPSSLIQNPDFEENPLEKPKGWETISKLKIPGEDATAVYLWDNKIFHSGKGAIKITKTSSQGVAGWAQDISGLESGRKYQLSFWVKTEEMANERGGFPFNPLGTVVEVIFIARSIQNPLIYESNPITDTQDWQKRRITFIVPEEPTKITVRLIFGFMTGNVWFDDISILELPDTPAIVEKDNKIDLSRYGGWKKITGKTTGFFHTEMINNRWWIIDPEGNAFVVVGVDSVAIKLPDNPEYMQNVLKRRKTEGEWLKFIGNRLKDWGFNTISYKVPGIDGLAYGGLFGIKTLIAVQNNLNVFEKMPVFPDVFDERYKAVLDEDARESTNKADKWLLGYFLNNELAWNGDARRMQSFLFDSFMAMGRERAGKRNLVDFLRKRYRDNVTSFNEVWGTNIRSFDELFGLKEFKNIVKWNKAKEDKLAFLRIIANTYFRLNYEAIKKYDPNHMILGCRFVGAAAPKEVLEEMSKYVDIVSFQPYTLVAPLEFLEESYRLNHKPVMITEFSFASENSGLPNSIGAGFVFKNQAQRGIWYERYVDHLLSSSFMVGWIWFRYMDSPEEGNWQGENINYGLVNKKDDPYTEFIDKISEVNSSVYNKVPIK